MTLVTLLHYGAEVVGELADAAFALVAVSHVGVERGTPPA